MANGESSTPSYNDGLPIALEPGRSAGLPRFVSSDGFSEPRVAEKSGCDLDTASLVWSIGAGGEGEACAYISLLYGVLVTLKNLNLRLTVLT